MSLLTALARLHAADTGKAQPLSRIRHHHLDGEPLVVVILNHSGEAAAPLAAMVGTNRRRPRLLHVTHPRQRAQRMAFFAELAGELLDYIAACQRDTEAVPGGQDAPVRQCFTRAPQLLVANPATRDYLGLLGRATRFLPDDGPDAVDPAVRRLGQWLTFLTERAEIPGSSVLPAVTELLSWHWATGQSALEDTNLAAFVSWIDPPAPASAVEAARAAEDPLRHPPAGPATDPGFDNHVLQRCLAAIDHAREHGADAADRAGAALRRELESQVRPTWELVWRGVRLLRGLSGEAPSVGDRWREDRFAFTGFTEALEQGRSPQPRRDSAVAAARWLDRMERAQARFAARCALEDPFLLAERRLSGEAVAGPVVDRDPGRLVTSAAGGQLLRPRVVVRTGDPVRLGSGQRLRLLGRDKLVGEIAAVEDDGEETLVTVDIVGGVGRGKAPSPGSVPELEEELCLTPGEDFAPTREFPPLEETPWTHGGPPAEAGADGDRD